MNCGKFYDAQYVKKSEGVPKCSCGGVVKPDVVLYEEGLDEETIRGAVEAIASADMLLIGGTSLVVYPAAGFIDYFRGSRLAVINKSETVKYPIRTDDFSSDRRNIKPDKSVISQIPIVRMRRMGGQVPNQ